MSAVGSFTEKDFKEKGCPLRETRYENNLEFENYNLKCILTENGYIENNKYYFYLKDHLGNNRVVSDQSGVIVQRMSYYPFGMPAYRTGEGMQPYKFGGKELEAMHGLNLYDFHARQQMPDLGIFTTIDPLAEKNYSVSPYAYCNNNPVKYIDPTGMFIENIEMEKWLQEIAKDKDKVEKMELLMSMGSCKETDNVGINGRGEEVWRIPAPGDDVMHMSADEITLTGQRHTQLYGQTIYGMWNEYLFTPDRAKIYEPSINWGGTLGVGVSFNDIKVVDEFI